eukprot:gene31301-39332_t
MHQMFKSRYQIDMGKAICKGASGVVCFGMDRVSADETSGNRSRSAFNLRKSLFGKTARSADGEVNLDADQLHGYNKQDMAVVNPLQNIHIASPRAEDLEQDTFDEADI